MGDAAEEFDLDASMQETLKEIEERENDDIESKDVSETETPAGDDAEAGSESEGIDGDDTGTENRDEKGRFKAKEDDQEESSGEGIQVSEDQTIKPVEEEKEDPRLALPPTTWSGDAKSKWKDLPAWARQEVKKREEDSIKGVNNLKQQAEFSSQLNQVIQPYQAMIQAEGGTPITAIQSLLNTAYQLRTGTPQQKGQLIQQLAQQYGADMNVEADPNTQQFQNALMPIQQQIQSLQQNIQTQQQTQEQQETAAMEQIITEFRDELNESGELEHPYYTELEPMLIANIQAIRTSPEGQTLSHREVLQRAYDQAVWANPDTRALMQSEHFKAEETKRQEEAKKRAEEAKKADKVNLGKKPSHDVKAPTPTGSIDDTMNETYQKILNRDS